MATEPDITFEDLIRLLEGNPEYRSRLRQQILDEEFLRLPAETRAQAERFDALTARVETLTERVDALTKRVDELTERVDALTERVDELTERVDALTKRVDELTKRVDALTKRVDGLTEQVKVIIQRLDGHDQRLDFHQRQLARLIGDEAERRFQRNAPAYFSSLMRRIRVLDPSELADLVDDAVDSGLLNERDGQSLKTIDLAARGLDRATREPMYLAVEVSAGIGERDIRRSAQRAGSLATLSEQPVQAVVAGYSIAPAYRQLATDLGVAVTIISPPDAGEPEVSDEPEAMAAF